MAGFEVFTEGDRKLVLVNHHQSRIAAYDVNCLLPRDPNLRIAAQKRNYSQSVYEMDYEETDHAERMAPVGMIWLTPVALFLTARLVSVWIPNRANGREQKLARSAR